MSNIKIDQYVDAEDAIRNHARSIKGCRNLTYSVCTSNFDAIWERARPMTMGMGMQRLGSDAPRLVLDFGRHHATVGADDAVPAGEVKCLTADDATMSEAAS